MANRWEITKAVRRSSLPAASRLVMFVLADAADVGTAEIPPQYTPSLSVLAAETGLDRRTVQRHLDALEDGGWLQRSRPSAQAQGHRERVKYRLVMPTDTDPDPVAGDHPQPVAEDRPTGGTEPPDGWQGATGTGGTVSHNGWHETAPKYLSLTKDQTTTRSISRSPSFESFYATYPRKVGHKAAEKAWLKALKDGADPEAVLAGAERYRRERDGQDPQYTKHPATWLNQGCWEDDPAPLVSANDYRPWTNPTDLSVYDEEL